MSSVNAPATHAAAAGGIRERKKQETRDALHRAALRLYVERGPEAVTISDICEAANVSRRTFFNYFDSKDDAVLDRDEEGSGRSLPERIAARPEGEDPLEVIHQAVRAGIVNSLDHPTWRERQQLVRRHPQLVQVAFASTRRTRDLMAEGIARRTDQSPDDLYPRVVASAAHAVAQAALARWNPEDSGAELLEILDESFAIAASGFHLKP